MEDLEWIQNWYHSQCDGDWEHQFGIKIDTLDNPGWMVTINLEGTPLEGKEFKNFDLKIHSNNWLICFVKDNMFEGRSSPFNLTKILNCFRTWVES